MIINGNGAGFGVGVGLLPRPIGFVVVATLVLALVGDGSGAYLTLAPCPMLRRGGFLYLLMRLCRSAPPRHRPRQRRALLLVNSIKTYHTKLPKTRINHAIKRFYFFLGR